VNVPGDLPGMPLTRPIKPISSLPGVVSHAEYVGLNGAPPIHGRVNGSFLTNSLNGSLDGEYSSQDRMTVLAGRLPPQRSTTDIVLTPALARLFGAGIDGSMRLAFAPGTGRPAGSSSGPTGWRR